LCCYWFEKGRTQIALKKCQRAGLLATQGIRGGANRRVLERIQQTGDIFFAESDRDWVLEGATVHVSMVGFDDGTQTDRVLDGTPALSIHANLRATTDTTQARSLGANLGLCFMGDTKGGAFDIPESLALEMLHAPNPHGKPNSTVIVPWVNAKDVTGRSRNMWIIDFATEASIEAVSRFESPFCYLDTHVRPVRHKSRTTAPFWWRHERPRPEMREAIRKHNKFLITIGVGKHRLFLWIQDPTLPDHAVFAFPRSDDYFFGVLHSRVHEVWALAQGTQVRERESGFRYTPTTCFETFRFPQPTPPQEAAIAAAAKELDELRSRWLNPPEWTKTEVLEFPGSADGPWARYVVAPDARGIGTVRWPRIVPKDADCAASLKKRTLTNLYNQRPAWLDLAHQKLDAAVFAAYGWEPGISDDELLAGLLRLNLERAAATP
jgi:hypothetical protein